MQKILPLRALVTWPTLLESTIFTKFSIKLTQFFFIGPIVTYGGSEMILLSRWLLFLKKRAGKTSSSFFHSH